MASSSVGSVGYVEFGDEEKDNRLVVAIDLGTTYSGYAFSLRTEYQVDPGKVSFNCLWIAGSMNLLTLKTPTCVLFNENQKFHSFGYEAENQYTELVLDEENVDWYFFKRFKMRLQGKKKEHDVEMEDTMGRTMPAKKVFGEVVRYLKDQLLRLLKSKGIEVEKKDIHWVLTVPVIWSDSAKQLMREAAYLAGIDEAHLSIALEPVAASLYCQQCIVDNKHGSNSAKVSLDAAGTKFMVLDLGGGTVDITVHQRHADGTLQELHTPDGGPWGGAMVDEGFFHIIIKIIGGPCFNSFCIQYPSDFIDLKREFEMRKRTIRKDTTGKVTTKVPLSLADTYENQTGETVKEALKNSTLKEKIVWNTKDKLRIDAELFKDLFKPSCENIVGKIKYLLKEPKVKGTNIFLMVGGFSESELVQDAVRTALPQGTIIIPDEPGLAVMKGAVIFGHREVVIIPRVA